MSECKRYHMHLSLRGALNWPNGGWFTFDELREAFYDDIAAGKEVVPIGECDNFDFKTGCLGHPVAESV